MSENIQNVIQKITYFTPKFPEKEFQFISDHIEEAVPYLYQAVDLATERGNELDHNYMLHLYALYFLAQFQDKNAFGKIMGLVSLPDDIPEKLLNEFITEDLKHVLYLTYNGDLDSLIDAIRNPIIDDFVRSAMLDVMGQLYLDQILPGDEWKAFLRELAHTEELGDCIYTSIVGSICDCKLYELLPDVRYLHDELLVDQMMFGDYSDCLDILFEYRPSNKRLCLASLSAADKLKNWAMFQSEEDQKRSSKQLEHVLKKIEKGIYSPFNTNHKVGRNEPCPCGSGKKYKHCCLNKKTGTDNHIESEEEQRKWLRHYPEITEDKVEGRIYLDDYFDADSIKIDKNVYLALHHRAIPIWVQRDEHEENKIMQQYLWLAFEQFEEKLKKEKITSARTFDEKHSIHYLCEEWLNVLRKLTADSGNTDQYQRVTACLEALTAGD